jgi:segregation and condensation protein A
VEPGDRQAADGDGEGGSPRLTLDGFSGPLERLLILARAQQIDLARLPVTALVDQLSTALRHAGRGRKSLGQQGDWVVMAAWLLLLRSQLLLPANEPAQAAATAEADRLRARLGALRDMQALADWLERQPQLGRDVFARGQPELLGTAFEPAHQVDGIEFLWASLALFDDDPAPDTESLYRPLSSKFYDAAAARARILRVLATVPDGAPLERFLPTPPDSAETEPRRALRRRAAWASTLIGGLELAKQGDVVLAQQGDFQTIQVSAGGGQALSSAA